MQEVDRGGRASTIAIRIWQEQTSGVAVAVIALVMFLLLVVLPIVVLASRLREGEQVQPTSWGKQVIRRRDQTDVHKHRYLLGAGVAGILAIFVVSSLFDVPQWATIASVVA